MFNNILRRNSHGHVNGSSSRTPIRSPVNNVRSNDNHIVGRSTVLVRSNSQETLTTLVTDQDQHSPLNNASIIRTDSPYQALDSSNDMESLYSDATTLYNEPIEIMGRTLPQYNAVKQLPLISTFFHSGTMMFKSINSFDKYLDTVNESTGSLTEHPILQTFSSKLGLLKINSPILSIYRFKTCNEKYEFVKVYFKVVTTYVNYYILKFFNEKGEITSTVHLLNNNSHTPTVDFNLYDTNFRIIGVTGTSSTFGTNSLIKAFVMRKDAELLSNDLEFNEKDQIKNLKQNSPTSNTFFKLIESQDRRAILNSIEEHKPLVNTPMCQYLDEGNVKLKKSFLKNGTFRLFDYQNDDISEEGLKLCSILLVLREQEYRKFKSNNKPTYIANKE
ncbi:uncharacterized protein RJT21DRAFT_119543 [Scheffersomyces amazonensis]|uniref:uncharacterized protein n=1 Tax=Scheffersomyces amazonensis TaxID=1078765 RepID=UPI00315C70C3